MDCVIAVGMCPPAGQDLLRYSDDEQLVWAADRERALFTYNASDFCRLHAEFMRQGRHHAGIIIGDQQSFGW